MQISCKQSSIYSSYRMAYPLLRFAGFEIPRAIHILVASNRISSLCKEFSKQNNFSTAAVITSPCSAQPPYLFLIGRLLPSPSFVRGYDLQTFSAWRVQTIAVALFGSYWRRLSLLRSDWGLCCIECIVNTPPFKAKYLAFLAFGSYF